jgi:hypothetical protein
MYAVMRFLLRCDLFQDVRGQLSVCGICKRDQVESAPTDKGPHARRFCGLVN